MNDKGYTVKSFPLASWFIDQLTMLAECEAEILSASAVEKTLSEWEDNVSIKALLDGEEVWIQVKVKNAAGEAK